MPIPVVCTGCRTRFSVSEKFAGKQGPCPKCKAIITIPKLEEQVVVHAPEEFASGGKDAQGRPATKPIARQETKLKLVSALIVCGGAVVVLAVTWLLREMLQANLPLRAVGLLLVSPPIAVGGYTFLRNDELEPYRRTSLWIRAVICASVYVGLWGVFYLVFGNLAPDALRETWMWFFVVPVFIAVGACPAMFCFDLDYGSGSLHYCFYVLLTLALGIVSGLNMPWSTVTKI